MLILLIVLLNLYSACGDMQTEIKLHERSVRVKDTVSLRAGVTDIVNDSVKFNYNSTVKKLKKTLGRNFVIKTYSCFVVASNLEVKETQKIIDHTIAEAEKCFYNDYFEKKPDEIVTIYLFKDEKSYRTWAKKLFGDDDVSSFGYYKPSKRAMLMNIATGGGTLVHELTHAFVRYDFPDIPVWFNEGLGSLYERCSMKNKIITGLVNWRLPSVQKAIKNRVYTGLGHLINTGGEEFYGENSGFYYAQARYFCMYLQEKGLLKTFYKKFRDGYEDDKTGEIFITEVLNKSVAEIDREFAQWVWQLKYDDN
ncbi:MAG: hypothetical protein NTV87_11120 [Ignavibacteriae bacterium]|nr:hypothetical protein [Ignavibacteriota bacterium]